MTEKTIHLKTMGAEHIASTTVSLGRPQPVVARWGKLHFFLGGLGIGGLRGEALRQVREYFQFVNISRLFPSQGEDGKTV